MFRAAPRPRLVGAFADWARDRRGSAAIEFAFVAPVLVMILLGSIEAVDLYRAQRAAVVTANTVADLTSRAKVMDDDEIALITAAAETLLESYVAISNVRIIITSVQADSDDGDQWVRWSASNISGAAYNDDEAFDPEMELNAPLRNGDTMIVAELSFSYAPRMSSFMFQSITFERFAFRSPRYVPRIPYSPQDP